MNVLTWLNTKVLGGALAASLIANIFLFWGYTHQTEQKATCTQAVKTVNQQATEKKLIIEKRQDNVSTATEDNLRRELAALRSSMRTTSGQPDLPRVTYPAAVSDGTSTYPVLLPEDELICNINTLLAQTWQQWWLENVKIREEENGTDTTNDRVLGSRGGASTGSVSRQRERVDVGLGSDERIRAQSLPALLREPAKP